MFPVIDFPFPFAGFFQDWFQAPKPKPTPKPVEPPAPPSKLLHVGEVATTGKRFTIDPADYAESGDRDVILASSGMGKSYLAGVLVEETIEAGGLVFIIDPEGENHTLAERYPMLIIGGGNATTDIDLDTLSPERLDEIVDTVLSEGLSTIFNLSGRTNKNQQALFSMIARSFFRAQENPENRRPVKMIVEEARVFAPQKAAQVSATDGESSLLVFEDIATRGRKRGVNFLMATQRPASINKDVLSQCNRFWFGGMQSSQDCDAMKPYLRDAGISEDQIRALRKGQFYFYSEGRTTLINVKKRKCAHGGATPDQQKDWKVVRSKKDAAAIAAKIGGKRVQEIAEGL